MTQRELAERVGTSRTAVTHWENGKNPPTGKNIKKLEKIFADIPWLQDDTLAGRIKRFEAIHNTSQQDMINMLGINPQTYYKIMRGEYHRLHGSTMEYVSKKLKELSKTHFQSGYMAYLG